MVKFAKKVEKKFTPYWEQHKISQIADRFDNLRVPVTASKRQKGSTPYYGANGIQDYVNGYTHDGEFLLIAEDGANDIRNYPVNYVNGKVWVNNHAHVIKGKANIANNLFLQYAFKSINIESYLVGGGRAKLTAEVMMRLPIKLPSIEEQNKIGKLVHSLDDTITLHEEKQKQLEQLKKALLQKMFADKSGYPKIRFKGFSEPWEQVKSKELFKNISDKNHSDLPVLSATQQNGMVYRDNLAIDIKYDQKSLANYKKVSPTDFVISLRSFQGGFEMSDKEGIVSPAYTVFNFKNRTNQSPIFWKYLFKRYNFIESLKKVTFGIRDGKAISFGQFGDTKPTYPSLKEQEEIGKFFEKLDRTITLHAKKIESLKQLKQALLQQMFI
ncbi:restriction endonuclease subunit S [Lactobacillus equicursoris]|uniref:restriction endonuclease subunit S n=1 Tax=Lactobacillus equicursoris TaxID=420645 RepID=UPI0024303148|nr:restriction endonuclease subunit S [Lactobacillus equicursoris]MDD6386622.1 restriction endonuclease subunit S [Lactobacillus equicursoris]